MKVASLTVDLEALEPARLPRYKGAVFRGGFGLAFRRVACPFLTRECADCLLRQQCVWFYVFATPRPEGATLMPRSETVPHPFVIEPPEDDRTRIPAGDRLSFGLILIGRALAHVPYFILAFEQMAEQGLGSGRARFRLTGVKQDGEQFYDPESATLRSALSSRELLASSSPTADCSLLTLRFLTPTRIVHQGRICRRPQFSVLVRSLLRRVSLLSHFHDEPEEVEHDRLTAEAEKVRLTDAVMAGDDWRHFSRRQQRLVEREGVTGWVRYEGELGQFLPLLRAGEVLHVGKGTSFGMGKYELVRSEEKGA